MAACAFDAAGWVTCGFDREQQQSARCKGWSRVDYLDCTARTTWTGSEQQQSARCKAWLLCVGRRPLGDCGFDRERRNRGMQEPVSGRTGSLGDCGFDLPANQ
jgi:hypothetical protein